MIAGMCARFVSRVMAAMERVVAVQWHDPFELIYNAAPSMSLSVITADADDQSVRLMKWGLIPGWWQQAKPPKLTINTRSEEAADKPMWKAAFRQTRCLVPAVGWYEWRSESRVDTTTGEIAEVRRPHFIHLDGLAPVCFAGLWSSWRPDRASEPLLTFSILTRGASPQLARVHDRMPVVLSPDAYQQWLDPSLEVTQVQSLIRTRSLDDFRAYPVTTYVNNPRNQGERCIEEVPPDEVPDPATAA